MKKQKGFTIIEMLIVIAIISIIFSAMRINITGLQNEAKTSKARADLKTLQLAIESYYKNYMYEFPPKRNCQRVLLEATPRILEANVIDPFGGTTISQYIYDLSPNETYYVIYSLGIGSRGEALVSNDGVVELSWNPVWVSNGHL